MRWKVKASGSYSISIILILLLHSLSAAQYTAQVNNPVPTIPFGSLIQADPTPYPYGMVPGNLPAGAYTPGSNLYGKSQNAYSAYVSWCNNYIEQCNVAPEYFRVKYDNVNQTVSEGIGYGMLLAAYAGDKRLLDGLWGYYKSKADVNGLMNWCRYQCSNTGTGCGGGGTGAATDAEFDVAMALLIAEYQWPAATSPYDYQTEAQTIIANIRIHEMHPTTYQTLNGDMWGAGNTCRNPSYQAPAYFKQYALNDPSAPAGFWNNCVAASYSMLNTNKHATTGLVSNWCNDLAVANGCNGPNEYGYDACRNPWRMATDFIWNNESNASGICDPMTNWLLPIGSTNVKGPRSQAGGNGVSTGYHNTTFVSTYALAVMAATNNASNQTFLNQMYTETVNITEAPPVYFGPTLRVISLFVMTGNFWKPGGILPVSLVNFEAKKISDQVLLSWQTISEKNTAHFQIEKSGNSSDWTTIGQVNATGTSSSIVYYSFNDLNIADGFFYYRLKITDFDNSYEYSEVRKVLSKKESEIIIFPNPFNESFSITFSEQNALTSILIESIDGKILYKKELLNGGNETIHPELSTGIYLLKINNGNNIFTKKLVKY
jgi:endo-1,4-beta-D-glucanase Y